VPLHELIKTDAIGKNDTMRWDSFLSLNRKQTGDLGVSSLKAPAAVWHRFSPRQFRLMGG